MMISKICSFIFLSSIILMLLAGISALLPAPATAQTAPTAPDSSFFLMPDHPYSHFLFRKGDDGQPQRVFALGVYTNLLHPRYFKEHDTRHQRIPNEELFRTLREHFNFIYSSFTYVGEGVTRPSYYDSLDSDAAFVMGAGHLPWWLRTNYSSSREGHLTQDDQETLAERIDVAGLQQRMVELRQYAGNSKLIINLSDEPERGGYGDSWHYSRETLSLMYQQASLHGIVSLGLGPVGNAKGQGVGNKLTWTLNNPNPWFGNPGSWRVRQTSQSWKEILDTMLTYYDNTYDIIYLNSYAFIMGDTRRSGQIVKEMLHHPTIDRNHPVWPWISTENFRYGNTDLAYESIRRQAFSALANEASGLMLYPDVRVSGKDGVYDETLWHHTLSLAKEIGFWRPVLENGRFVENYIADQYEWIHYQTEQYDVLFLANHGSDAITLKQHGSVEVEGGQSGIWYREQGQQMFTKYETDQNERIQFP